MARAVLCIVNDSGQAARVIALLREAGLSSESISALFTDEGDRRDFAGGLTTKAPEGAVTGAGAGGVLGGALGWLVGIGSLALPGLGSLIAAGPILTALSGAAIGAAAGGLTGALIGMGISEPEARQYEVRVKGGDILISVHTDDPVERGVAKGLLERSGAQDIRTTPEVKAA